MRGLAKAKAAPAELVAACEGVPGEEAQKAGSSGRPKELLAAFTAFRQEVAALAAAGAPAGEVLAACDRCVGGARRVRSWRQGCALGCNRARVMGRALKVLLASQRAAGLLRGSSLERLHLLARLLAVHQWCLQGA